MRLSLASIIYFSAYSAFAQTEPKVSDVKKLEKDVADVMSPDSAQVAPKAGQPYTPITGKQRLAWFVNSTAGPESLFLSGPISAGWGTLFHSPEEYPPTWEGFGQRYGMRLTGVSTGNAITAASGAIWGEDPRYFPLEQATFKQHVWQVVKLSFMSRYSDGEYHFGYAKLAGNVGNNFLSNTWRVPSESTAGQASLRCVYGVLGRMAGNAFSEFWPQVKTRVFKK
jgi:hypothetical protein